MERKGTEEESGMKTDQAVCEDVIYLGVGQSEASFCCCSVFSHVQLFATSWTAARQASLSFTISQSLLKLMSIELVLPSNHLTLCRPLLFLLSIFLSIRVFSNESALPIRWPKYWSFSFSISPSNEYSGLISFKIHWFDLLAIQKTLKSLLQHHDSKALIFQCLAFFLIPLLRLHTTVGETIALTIWTWSAKQMSRLFNTLSRFVITFLPMSNCLLTSWLQSPSSVILEPKKIKSVTVSTFPPCICHEVMGPDACQLGYLKMPLHFSNPQRANGLFFFYSWVGKLVV